MPYSVETFRITPVENGLPTTTVTVERSDLEAQVDAAERRRGELGDDAARRRLPGRWLGRVSGGATSIRSSAGRSSRCRRCRSSAATTGSGRSSPLQFRGSVTVSPGPVASRRWSASRCSACSTIPGDAELRHPAAGAEPVDALLRRLGPEADAADRRLPVQAQPRHLCPRLGRHPRAVVRRRRAARCCGSRSTRAGGSGSSCNWVAQRDFYSPFGFGYYDYDVVTGHATLYWDTGWNGHRDAVLRRPLPRRRLGRHGRRAAALRQRLVGRRLCHQDRRHRRRFRRGQLRQGRDAHDPAALDDAVRDPADDQRRPDARSRTTAARSSTSRTGSTRSCATSTATTWSRTGGRSGNDARALALALACCARGLRQRRQGSDRRRRRSRRSAASGRTRRRRRRRRRGRSPAPTSSGPTSRRSRRGSRATRRRR